MNLKKKKSVHIFVCAFKTIFQVGKVARLPTAAYVGQQHAHIHTHETHNTQHNGQFNGLCKFAFELLPESCF